MSVWILIGGAIAGAYVALNVAAIVWNRAFALPKQGAFPAVNRLLVVAPHQDDETIMAGGLMARLAGGGADVRVIMVTDGATARPGKTEAELGARHMLRNRETISALATIGIAERQIEFVAIPAEKGLRNPSVVGQGIETLSKIMAEVRPDAVVTTAFEGGHPDHDATNYIVARAARRAHIAADRLYEVCEYNGYFLSSAVLSRLNRLMLVRFFLPPRFIPGRNSPMRLDMSAAELERKRAMLRQYKSQKPDLLVQLFGFPDQFRVMEAHDYSRGPYDPSVTWRYRLCRLLGGSANRCNPFNYGISMSGYAELYGTLEAGVHAA